MTLVTLHSWNHPLIPLLGQVCISSKATASRIFSCALLSVLVTSTTSLNRNHNLLEFHYTMVYISSIFVTIALTVASALAIPVYVCLMINCFLINLLS